MDKLNDWLQGHQTAVAVIAPVGAALSALGIRFAPGPKSIGLFVLLLAGFTAIPSLAGRLNKLQQGRKEAERCLKRLLQACGHSFGYPGTHIRVNIMRFTEKRHRRKVDGTTAFNMDKDPDSDLEIDVNAGVSGQAVLNRKPSFGNLALPLQAGGPDWGLTDKEKAKVRQTLQSMLSTPVFDPSNTDGNLLATLQIDSDLPLDQSGLDQQENWLMAERFADVVSLILETGR